MSITLWDRTPKNNPAEIAIGHLSIEIVRIARRARRNRLVVTLKRIEKPFAMWSLFVPLVSLGRSFLSFTRSGPSKLDSFKKPIPAYSLLIILLLGIVGGAYASLALTQGVLPPREGPPDFSIGTVPPSSTAYPGSLAMFTIRTSSLNGFTGSVNLTTTETTAGITSLVNPNSVSLFTGNATSNLTVSVGGAVPTGTYAVNVTGSSGKISHIAQLFLSVTPVPPPDFVISANPAILTLNRGTSGTSSLTLTSLGGFSGTITISATVSPLVANGPTTSLNPGSVTVPPGGSVNSLLTVSTFGTTPRQGYTIFVLATSGALSHSIQISLTVQ